MNTTTHDELRDILLARDVERKNLINDFLMRRKPVFLRHSAQLCHHFSQSRNTMFEDIAQIVAQTAFEMILEILKTPDLLDQIQSFEAVLKTRSQYAVGQYLRSSAHTTLSGMGNVERRRALIAKTRRSMLAQNGVEPTDKEVIEETNRRLYETNKDPKRSGFLVSEADLSSNVRVSSLIDEVDRPDVDPANQPDSTGALGLHMAERPRFFKLVRNRLSFHDDAVIIGNMAEYWLATSLDGEMPSGKDLADKFGLEIGRARAYLRTIKKATAEVLEALNEEVETVDA